MQTGRRKITSYQEKPITIQFTDEELQLVVLDSINDDPSILEGDKQKISVKVKNGVVWLTGEVRNLNSKVRALTVAFWCDGVTDVRDTVRVITGGERAIL